MNYTDFTALGGYPLTQDDFKFMYDSIRDMFKAFGVEDGTQMNLVLSGLEADNTVGYLDGYLMFEGEILPYVSSTAGTGGGAANVYICEQRTSAVFENATSNNIQDITRFATMDNTLSGIIATMGPMSSFERIEAAFGRRIITTWEHVTFTNSFGFVTGDIYYRLNKLTRTLHIRGSLTVSNAQSIPVTPLAFYSLYQLPNIYRPANTAPFKMLQRYHNINQADIVKDINAEVQSSGYVTIGLIKPVSGVSSYVVSFNEIISMD